MVLMLFLVKYVSHIFVLLCFYDCARASFVLGVLLGTSRSLVWGSLMYAYLYAY